MSGDDGEPFRGSLVLESSFNTPNSEFPMSSAKVLPLSSLSWENQRESCALKSPSIRASFCKRKVCRLGL